MLLGLSTYIPKTVLSQLPLVPGMDQHAHNEKRLFTAFFHLFFVLNNFHPKNALSKS
jgi:hypothetical protein